MSLVVAGHHVQLMWWFFACVFVAVCWPGHVTAEDDWTVLEEGQCLLTEGFHCNATPSADTTINCVPITTTYLLINDTSQTGKRRDWISVSVTLQWARWCLKSPASRLFTTVCWGPDQRNIKAPRHWPFWGDPPVSDVLPSRRASDAENVSILWRHHFSSRWLNPVLKLE